MGNGLQLSDEQLALRGAAAILVSDFADARPPVAVDAARWRHIADLGWTAVHAPESPDGIGLSAVEVALLMEETGCGLMRSPFLANVVLAQTALLAAAPEWAGEFACLRHRGGLGNEEAFSKLGIARERRLAGGGWVGLRWPTQHGGRAPSLELQLASHEECVRAGGPGRLGHIGEPLLAPTLIELGTPEQQARVVPGIREGREFWCQGYWESGAGSDLAAILTRCWQDGAATNPDCVLGEPGDAWRVVVAAPGFERETSALGQQLHFVHETQLVIDAAKGSGAACDREIRERITDAWIGCPALHHSASRIVATRAGLMRRVSSMCIAQWHRTLGQLVTDLLGDSGRCACRRHRGPPATSIFLLARRHHLCS